MGNKILIIDDDVDFVESEKLLLESNGYEVIAAFDGQEGYRKALDENPDLILLDVVMTTEDEGFQIAHRLKRDIAHAHIPIIILSSMKKGIRPRKPDEFKGAVISEGAERNAEPAMFPLPSGNKVPGGNKVPSGIKVPGGNKVPSGIKVPGGSSLPVDEYIEKPVDPQKLLSTLRRILQKNLR
jgi:CheY-like chemotaxis protein